jgi:hypothetical protein
MLVFLELNRTETRRERLLSWKTSVERQQLKSTINIYDEDKCGVFWGSGRYGFTGLFVL